VSRRIRVTRIGLLAMALTVVAVGAGDTVSGHTTLFEPSRTAAVIQRALSRPTVAPSSATPTGPAPAQASTPTGATPAQTSTPTHTATDPAAHSPSPSPSPSPTLSLPSTGPLRVVGLGDSVVAGARCDCPTFVERYGRMESDRLGRQVEVTNDGADGLTAGQLADQLAAGSDVAAQVSSADVVLVTVGANDLTGALAQYQAGGCDASCQDAAVSAMAERLRQALTLVDALGAGHPQTVLVTTYWNVFLDGDVARREESPDYQSWTDQITRKTNTAICAAAGDRGDTCVDLYAAFKADGSVDPTPLLAWDGDHPDAEGHQVIADALVNAGLPARTCSSGCA
jgi:lysophospholipase L1-like esterase